MVDSDDALRGQARRALFYGLAWGLGMILLGLAAWVFLRRAAARSAAAGSLVVGQPAPDFTLRTLTGDEVRLGDQRGRVVVLNLWATWCEPCKAEMPLLQALAVRHPDDLVVLGVNYGEEPETVAAFVDEYGLTFPILLDPQHQVVRLYGVRGLPTTVFIDAQGRVQGVHLGALDAAALRKYLRPLGVEP
ncbi:MAG: TlpA family protein disulfide reductase [Chloroflexi bacterium]|nr:TlpA family protein disulfide reductase [Chloroflexota bacterium]